MKIQMKPLVFVLVVVAVGAGISLGLRYNTSVQSQKQQEITAYLEKFRPAVPEGASFAEIHGLLPDRATTPVIENYAELIVEANVVTINKAFKDEHGLIYHTVTLNVDNVLKGSTLAKAGELVEVQILGGTVDDTVSWSLLMPHFEEGENVIVFLSRAQDVWYVAFDAFGKVSIKDGEAVGIDDEKGVFEKPVTEYERQLQGYIAS